MFDQSAFIVSLIFSNPQPKAFRRLLCDRMMIVSVSRCDDDPPSPYTIKISMHRHALIVETNNDYQVTMSSAMDGSLIIDVDWSFQDDYERKEDDEQV